MDSTKLFYFYLCDVWREFMFLVEQNFQEFGEAVVLWAYGMTDRKMPGDWPDRLADFLADWEDEHGTIVEDESLPVLFDWVAALGRQRGALPKDPNVVYPEDAWMKCKYRVPVAPTPSSGANGQVVDGVLTLRAKDIGDVTWRELLRALAAYRLPADVRALMILVQGRNPRPFCTIYLSPELLRAFLQLPLADRQSIMSAASSASVEAAQAAITRAVAAKTAGQNPRQPSSARQSPVGQKLAPNSAVPYNQKHSPDASQTAPPASPQPIALAAADAEKKQPAGSGPPSAGGSAKYTFGWAPPGNKGGVDDSLWGSQKPKTWGERLALRDYWDRGMDTALLFWAFAPNASLFLQHFLANSGTKHTADVKSLTSKSTFANNYMVKDLNDAMAFAEANVRPGSGARIVTTGESAGRNAPDSLDWFYALGYYRTWARGTVSHGLEMPGLPAKFTMTWQYSIRDDYGFSAKPKKFGIGGGVADTEMAALNLAGYARSFEVIGTQTLTVEWHRGQRVGSGAKVTR